MDWVTLLKNQQEDFINRCELTHFLTQRVKGVFGESFVIDKKIALPLIKYSEILATNLPENSEINSEELVINIFKNKLIKHCLNLNLGDLLVEVNPEDNIIHHHLILALKDNHSFRIITKLIVGDYTQVKWSFSQAEIKKNKVLLCLFCQEDFALTKSNYNIILAGFLPTSLVTLSKTQSDVSLSLTKLLYGGGLRYYCTSHLDHKYDYLNQAKIHNSHGDYLSAIYCYNQVLQNNSLDHKVYLLRAIAHWKIGNQNASLVDLNQAIIIYPKYDLAYHWRGYIKYKMQDYSGAISDYSEEIKINPLSIYAYYRRALCYERNDNLLKAFQDYSQVIIFNNHLYQGYYNRGNVRYELGDKEGALEDYKKALQLNPSLAKAYYNLGIIYNDLGEIDQAIFNYKAAIKLVPNYAKAYYNLALIYVDIGKYRQAIIHYDKACELDNEFIQAKYNKQFLIEYLEEEKEIKYNPNYQHINEKKTVAKPEQFTPEKIADLFFKQQIKTNQEKFEIIETDDIIIKESQESNSEKILIDPWNTKPR